MMYVCVLWLPRQDRIKPSPKIGSDIDPDETTHAQIWGKSGKGRDGALKLSVIKHQKWIQTPYYNLLLTSDC